MSPPLELTLVEFEIPIYGGFVRMYSKKEDFLEACKAADVEGSFDLEECSGIVQPFKSDGSWGYIVGIFDGQPLTLVHECGHLAVFIFDDIRCEITEDTSEPFCYLLEELVRRGEEVLVS